MKKKIEHGIRLGVYRVRDCEFPDKVRIEVVEGKWVGECGDFSRAALAEVIDTFYNENF